MCRMYILYAEIYIPTVLTSNSDLSKLVYRKCTEMNRHQVVNMLLLEYKARWSMGKTTDSWVERLV